MPTYLNVLNNAILRANLPPSKGNPAAYGENSQITIKSLLRERKWGFIHGHTENPKVWLC